MLYDVRTYECRPGTIGKLLELYEKHGKVPQVRALGNPLAFLIGETGNPNRYIHIWVYENAADREERRKKMWSDPEWLNFTKLVEIVCGQAVKDVLVWRSWNKNQRYVWYGVTPKEKFLDT